MLKSLEKEKGLQLLNIRRSFDDLILFKFKNKSKQFC